MKKIIILCLFLILSLSGIAQIWTFDTLQQNGILYRISGIEGICLEDQRINPFLVVIRPYNSEITQLYITSPEIISLLTAQFFISFDKSLEIYEYFNTPFENDLNTYVLDCSLDILILLQENKVCYVKAIWKNQTLNFQFSLKGSEQGINFILENF